MQAVQMNTRIDAHLKERGDATLERIGVSCSSAVRALWECLAGCYHEPEKAREVLENLEAASGGSVQESRHAAALARSEELMASMTELLGTCACNARDELSYDSIREEAVLSDMQKAGALCL